MGDTVCVGTVTAVEGTRARVSFQDGEPSGWLHVLQHPGAALSLTPDGAGPHTHPGSVLGLWVPKVGDTVVVVYVPQWQGDGYIVGKVMG